MHAYIPYFSLIKKLRKEKCEVKKTAVKHNREFFAVKLLRILAFGVIITVRKERIHETLKLNDPRDGFHNFCEKNRTDQPKLGNPTSANSNKELIH